ncbi:flagellar hook-associated protein FlgK [Alkalilimnicola sp. S0819]|uniref:flagellar hook-associated protein FlgK n=1 Tax=Alkalilimnicola sp. S0819 TaxID=2613922 RepID=UPI0012618783|nr:flagellar hook-associated protein FlgK [Alkalilimnicola sp. S0819]KAB7627192.1 flagellar hook-associated protein FlgK [Alkalilimnicola sp. S0819]MPQ15905.1 flagellar hook-associated protein FlgK [Alkalilimnicola sp. S0819]
MANLLGTSVSAMIAAQRALATTSHNIANVNTEGYSRQRVEYSTRTPEALGSGFIGTGVDVDTVSRLFDLSREQSLRSNTTEHARLDALAELSGTVDNLLADEAAGLQPAMQAFFNAVQDAAADPTSPTARQLVLNEGESLATRFRFMDERFAELSADVERRLSVQVEEVNQFAQDIATLNQEIMEARGRTGQPPNDLLDQRDAMVRQLAERIDISVTEQDDGRYNIFIGRGQALVSASSAREIQVSRNEYQAYQSEISLVSAQGAREVTDLITGGSLGGILEFREQVLDPARNDLGRLAVGLSEAVNAQHRQGVHFADGVPTFGDDFFEPVSPLVLARGGGTPNGGTTAPDVALSAAGLTGDDYQLRFDAGAASWTLSNLRSGASETFAAYDSTSAAVPNDTGLVSFQGLTIDTRAMIDVGTATGDAVDGDSWLIRPTATAAASMGMNISRASELAVAAAVPSQALQNANTEDGNNQGTGALTAIQMPTLTTPLDEAVELSYYADLRDVYGNGADWPGGTLPAAPVAGYAVSGAGLDGYIQYDGSAPLTVDDTSYQPMPANPAPAGPTLADTGGLSFELSGQPLTGDGFALKPPGPGDNSNILALGAIQERAFMDNGTATLQQDYSAMVGEVGTKTLKAQTGRDAQELMLNQAIERRESYAGVNLEEEAANLMRFQQYFQAAAQTITVANSTFQSLLQAVQR